MKCVSNVPRTILQKIILTFALKKLKIVKKFQTTIFQFVLLVHQGISFEIILSHVLKKLINVCNFLPLTIHNVKGVKIIILLGIIYVLN